MQPLIRATAVLRTNGPRCSFLGTGAMPALRTVTSRPALIRAANHPQCATPRRFSSTTPYSTDEENYTLEMQIILAKERLDRLNALKANPELRRTYEEIRELKADVKFLKQRAKLFRGKIKSEDIFLWGAIILGCSYVGGMAWVIT